MTEKPRRPLYFCDPYTSKQYEAFRQAYIYAVRRNYAEPEALEFFNAMWPKIRGAADLCDRELSIWRHLNDKTKWNHRKDGKPSESETERARIRGMRANRFRNFRKAASCGDARQFIEKHPEQVDVLLYGAFRAGIIKPIEGRDDYSEEIAQLCQITPDQLKVAVAAASEKGSALVDDETRPSTAPVNNYVQLLIEVLFSHHVTNTPSGPAAVVAFEAALAPFHLNLTEHGVRRLVRRAGSAKR